MHLSLLLLTLLTAVAIATPLDAPHRLFGRAACDDSTVTPPTAPTPLPAPPAGTKNILVALGKGTQNYTCGSSSSAAPTPVGALATLYDASCAAKNNPSSLTTITHATANQTGPPQGFAAIGRHFFSDATTPVFVLNGVGTTAVTRTAASNAPNNTHGDVPWLYLAAKAAGTSTQIKAVYRVVTSGGSAPPTCAGKAPGLFTVNYAANYYFYSL